MAINDRATNTGTITTNLPDNASELITPLLHREVEYDLNDSCFNKIDEPRQLDFYANTDSPDSNIKQTHGEVTVVGVEIKSVGVAPNPPLPTPGAVKYSTNINGAGFILQGDFTAYQTFMLGVGASDRVETFATIPGAVSYEGELIVTVQYY